ncbi:MAG: RelA/SpoT family protein [Betaproteobacteria bacterium]
MPPTAVDPSATPSRKAPLAAPSELPASAEANVPLHVGVASVSQLNNRLAEYLTPAELKTIKDAYRFADEMHLGQVRRSGDPYISHPIAVAEICAEWKLDSQAIMAALLHDVMEDQDVLKDELIQRFGAPVASLVDGLSKLDKLEFQSQAEHQAENFRKMLLAMARDVRVILVKLADRLHNMRTLGAMSSDKRRRIARETMEVYVPIAHRLGLNNLYRELQDLSFAHLYPLRQRTIAKAIRAARGNRRELVGKILESVKSALAKSGIEASIAGREKTLYGIYRKMRNKHLSFSQVLDVYGFRVVVDSFEKCYVALGVLHALFKPMPGKFKDYIAIPKLNGYQSLHTTLIGPYGTPVEFQIRTAEMNHVAESGVAAHWLYKNQDAALTDLQQRTHAWLQSLLDIQHQTGDPSEFLEHVKVDLFPDSVYVFTPKSTIIALPRGATALDFAYTIHTDIGDHAVSAKINHEPAPLKTELHNGDIVAIDVSDDAQPTPNWLSFVRTGRARSAIRHHLRSMNREQAIEVGELLLEQALISLELPGSVPPTIQDKLVGDTGAKSMADINADIGTGRRLATLVARHIQGLMDATIAASATPSGPVHLPEQKIKPVTISGKEPASSVQFAHCCSPIPGDMLAGNLRRDQMLVVHTSDCELARRSRAKDPGRWIDVSWAQEYASRFNCRISVLVNDEKGLLARLAAQINESDSNIVLVGMDEGRREGPLTELRFTVQVEDRVHLARLMRNVRQVRGVARILRDKS